jgi:large subunit ribosomal protein L23
MKEPHKIIFKPLVTEKSTLSKEQDNQVAFEVDRKANKIEIRQAVEKSFGVRVLSVRTMNMQGKKKRMGRFFGRRPHWKKAIVKLAPGEHIDFFEGV